MEQQAVAWGDPDRVILKGALGQLTASRWWELRSHVIVFLIGARDLNTGLAKGDARG